MKKRQNTQKVWKGGKINYGGHTTKGLEDKG